MTTRTKKKVVLAPDEAEARRELHRFAESTSKLKGIEAEMEEKMQEIREGYSSRVAELTEAKAESFEKLNAFANENKEDLFSKRKSLELDHGVIGFRTGTPKVKKKTGITWAAALDIVKSMDLPYVRTKEEVDRDKIIATRKDEAAMAPLAKIGITVVQDETFFVEPKEEKIPA